VKVNEVLEMTTVALNRIVLNNAFRTVYVSEAEINLLPTSKLPQI